jgi:NAD(P)-dependent dehydrogenase (short-subunit alcohol dehydrogenase family)
MLTLITSDVITDHIGDIVIPNTEFPLEQGAVMPPSVLITGVSTGIGHAAAAAFVAAGYRVFGTLRQPSELQAAALEWGSAFHGLVLDVTDAAAIQAGVAEVEQALGGQLLHALINNAGIALPGPFAEQDPEAVRKMFEVNFFGALAMTRACLPLLGVGAPAGQQRGRVINVSSGAGQIGIPFLAGYVATKHALEGFSHALRRELTPWKIPVIIVGPGNVRTPIWDKAGSEDAYGHTTYGAAYATFVRFMRAGEAKGMASEQIAAVLLEAVRTKAPKVRYAPVAQKFANWTLPRLLPHRLLDAMLTKGMGLQAAPKLLPR